MTKYQFELSAVSDLDLSQYFGVWSIEPTRFRQMLAHVQSVDLVAHIAAHRDADVASPRVDVIEEGPQRETTIAVVHVTGTMTKRGSSFGAASSIRLRQEIRQAANDTGIDGILLVIDSPGGTVAGTADLAAEIKAADAKKPVYAQVDDCACSAAYWIASQARKVFANDRTALVGSIGTYMGLYDESDKYAADGVTPVLIATGPYKGAGFPGTEITDAQRAHFQEIIDQTQRSFAHAVADGREMSDDEITALADGRVWTADAAVTLRLVDSIQSIDDTLSQLATEALTERGTESMAAATVQEIKSACPGATSDFVVAQVEAGAGLETVRNNWMHELARQNAALRRAEEDRKEEEEREEKRSKRSKSKRSKAKRSKRSKDDDDLDAEDDDDLDAEDEDLDAEDDDDLDAEDEDLDAEDDDDLDAEDEEKHSKAQRYPRRGRRLRSRRRSSRARKPGQRPLRSGKTKQSIFADPASEFRSAVAKKQKAGLPRDRAVAAVVAEQPELHRAYLRSHNAAHGRR